MELRVHSPRAESYAQILRHQTKRKTVSLPAVVPYFSNRKVSCKVYILLIFNRKRSYCNRIFNSNLKGHNTFSCKINIYGYKFFLVFENVQIYYFYISYN